MITHTKICTEVFREAIFIVTQNRKQSRCPLTEEWLNKLWYILNTEYHSAIKRNILLLPTMSWEGNFSKKKGRSVCIQNQGWREVGVHQSFGFYRYGHIIPESPGGIHIYMNCLKYYRCLVNSLSSSAETNRQIKPFSNWFSFQYQSSNETPGSWLPVQCSFQSSEPQVLNLRQKNKKVTLESSYIKYINVYCFANSWDIITWWFFHIH